MTLKRLLVSFARGKGDGRKGPLFRTGPKKTPYGILTVLAGLKRGATFVKGMNRSFFKRRLESTVARIKVSTSKLYASGRVRAALTVMRACPSKSESFSFCHGPKTSVVLGGRRVYRRLVGRAGVFRFKALSVARRKIHRTAGRTVHVTRRSNTVVSFSPGLHPPL